MDGKDFSMIWTNNPNYKGKDVLYVRPKNYFITTYKVSKDSKMVIDIFDDNKKGNPGV